MGDFGKVIDPHMIRFERLLPGPIGRVWEYLTKPDCLATWLAMGETELRVGGEVELRIDVQEVPARGKAGAIIRGVVTRCEPPRALAYTWVDASPGKLASAKPGFDSIVTFELDPRGEDVLLVLTHRHLPSDLMPNFGAGWHTHLGILLARLRGEEPEEPFLPVYQRLLARYSQEGTKSE